MVSGYEVLVVVLAVGALVIMAGAALLGIITRLVRPELTDDERGVRRRRRARDRRSPEQ